MSSKFSKSGCIAAVAAALVFAAYAGHKASAGPIASGVQTTMQTPVVAPGSVTSDDGLYQPPLVLTDKNEYFVGEFINVSGARWAQDDVVQVDAASGAQTDYGVADGDGNFTDVKFFIPPEWAGQSVTITGTSLSGQMDVRAGNPNKTVSVGACGNAYISNVTGTGCVADVMSGPNQFWDIAAGGTYTVTLSGVTDCAHGGTDATIWAIVQNSDLGNYPALAAKVSTGVYAFSYPSPTNGCNTVVISYCTPEGSPNPSGAKKAKDKLGGCVGHLRFANFTAGCTNTGINTNCNRGACCNGASCFLATQIYCTSNYGSTAYQGDGTNYDINPCNPPQECSFSIPPGGNLGCNPSSAVDTETVRGYGCNAAAATFSHSCVTSVTCAQGTPTLYPANGPCAWRVVNTYTPVNDGNCSTPCTPQDQIFDFTVDTGLTITPPADGHAECSLATNNADDLATWQGGATVSGGCGAGAPTFVPGSDITDSVTCTRVVTGHWRVSSACSDAETPNGTFTISDTTAPTLSDPPGASTIECPNSPSFTAPTASDTCDPNATVVQDSVEGHEFTQVGFCTGIGYYTRTWHAVDCSGNPSAPKSQVINVIDTTKPTIGPAGADKEVQCPSGVSFSPPTTASDTCDGAPTIEQDGNDVTTLGSCPGRYTVKRTWRAKDCSGNRSDPVSQTVTVNDTMPPQFSGCPLSTKSMTCVLDQSTVPTCSTYSVTATDNCLGALTPTCSMTDTNIAGVHTRVITYSVSDGCNSNSCSQTVNWNEKHCSFTTGGYANGAGGAVSESVIDNTLLKNPTPGQLVIGASGHSLTLVSGDGHCIATHINGGGGGNNAISGNAVCSTGGVWANGLLRQAVTLALNMRYDTSLGGFAWNSAGKFCVNGSTVTISQHVRSAVTSQTVAGLMDLASRALGGTYTPGSASLDEINAALDAVNNAFDNCKCITNTCGLGLIADGLDGDPAAQE